VHIRLKRIEYRFLQPLLKHVVKHACAQKSKMHHYWKTNLANLYRTRKIMIVKPDFLDHWKTRLLIQITGDESAPLAVLRGWAYCQLSRRWKFPKMSPAQLAAVCHWGDRKPECHKALLEAGFLDNVKVGFNFHSWHIENAQLIQKWDCGKKGGRPKHKMKPTANRPVFNKGKPDGYRSVAGRKPTRPDQAGLDHDWAPMN
jgi:hypothetical protein